jgi:flagellar protein FlaF
VHPNPLQAYQSVEKATLPGRLIEAQVLSQAALKLRKCQEGWDRADRVNALDEALRFNQRVWTIFQAELGSQDNPMPDQIKRNLLLLSAFIDRRIFETMISPSPEKLNIIININENIAAGLRDKELVESVS